MDRKVLKVKVGSYTAVDGSVKNRYEEVGSYIEGDRGPYLLLKKTFNPAGVQTEEGRDMVLISIYEARDDKGGRKFEDDIPRGSDGIPF